MSKVALALVAFLTSASVSSPSLAARAHNTAGGKLATHQLQVKPSFTKEQWRNILGGVELEVWSRRP